MRSAEQLAELMATYAVSPVQQVAQLQFRQRLVESWDVSPGQKLLEIGCGQGDATIVLAEAIGSQGHVTAIDRADPSYGAPVNLGDSARHLEESPLGSRISFHFNVNVLEEVDFKPGQFDAVILALCTWYFEDLEELESVLQRVRTWAPRLCLAEWDLRPQAVDQYGHLIAVLIQGQVESRQSVSDANVRTPYSREQLHRILDRTGWEISREGMISAEGLDDARWEIDNCRSFVLDQAGELGFSAKEISFLQSQIDLLERLPGASCLPAYSIVAEASSAHG